MRMKMMNMTRTIHSMKKSLIILSLTAISIFALVTAASCSDMYVKEDNSPTTAWQEFCRYISDGDLKSAIEMTGNTMDVSSSDFENEVEGRMVALLYENISIRTVSDVDVKGVKAWQTVEISNIDLRLMIKKALAGIMEETSAYEWEHGSYKTDEQVVEAVNQSLLTQMNNGFDDCITTEKIRVEFRYKDGKWTPVMTEGLYNALTGYASETSECVDSFFKDYASKKSK